MNEQSLEHIEGDFWGDPPPDATALIRRVHGLRRKPIGDLEAEDLRVLIAQGEGHPVLVPVALSALEKDPMLEGDFYPGDVLVAVLRKVPRDYWAIRPADLARLDQVLAAVDDPDPQRCRRHRCLPRLHGRRSLSRPMWTSAPKTRHMVPERGH